MRTRLTWLIVTELVVGLVCAVAIAGEIVIYRQLGAIERRIETMDPPADLVASEIEELRARLGSLERKAASAARGKSKPKSTKAGAAG
jgi:hypothetical protein